MQSAASKRALSTLAAKIHPQLPLSPRESQQLLNLLTTSFRAHLDRAHPLPDISPQDKQAGNAVARNARRNSSPPRVTSSYASTTRHMDAILTNPLFAVKPRRRGSELAAIDVFRDPMAWFLNEIAKGTADLPKAAICLEALENPRHTAGSQAGNNSPASVIAKWLRTSGLDSSGEFIDLCITRQDRSSRFLDRLVNLLMNEGQSSVAWRWLARPKDKRIKETGCDSSKVVTFRQMLLLKIISNRGRTSINDSLTTFMQAIRLVETEGDGLAYSSLGQAGAHLVNLITANQNQAIDQEKYKAFLQSSQRWLGRWNPAVEAMLWLHHPTERNALVGLRYIKDPEGAVRFVNSSQSRRNFLVRLCLGVARELVDKKKFEDGRDVMVFLKAHFADIVLPTAQITAPQGALRERQRKEQENLEILDRLIPT